MKRFMFVPVAIACLTVELFCLDVAEQELDKGRNARVKFVACTGPYERIDTREAIFGIGEQLGRQIGSGSETAEHADKFWLLRIVDPSDQTRFSADILILREASQLDNVVNLHRLISGYLRAAFGYTAGRAAHLAELAVSYNALYRGNLDYFVRAYGPRDTPPECGHRRSGA